MKLSITLLGLLEREGRCSAGNLTRKLMSAGLLLKEDPVSYVLVKDALAELLTEGKVTKAGNGKSVHWKVS